MRKNCDWTHSDCDGSLLDCDRTLSNYANMILYLVGLDLTVFLLEYHICWLQEYVTIFISSLHLIFNSISSFTSSYVSSSFLFSPWYCELRIIFYISFSKDIFTLYVMRIVVKMHNKYQVPATILVSGLANILKLSLRGEKSFLWHPC